jgi:CubicO group peptidase (beta-lactamase class C family)
MQRTIMSISVLAAVVSGCGGSDQPTELRSVEPETVGWSADKLTDAVSIAGEIDSAAVLAMHDRDVFFSFGETEAKLPIHSIRKPLLGALYGIHVAAGDIDLDATLEELGIDDVPPVLTTEEKQATVRDLLKARSGVYHEANGEVQEMIDMRPERGSHAPDTFYYYNNWDFNVLGTIFEQETGLSVCEAFRIEIAEVIGMEDFTAQDCTNVYDLDRSIHPVYRFEMTARDMARFGLLYLRDGEWDGDQIIPQVWIDQSWTPYSTEIEEVGFGYGYLWAILPADSEIGSAIGHDVYFHGGLGVHILAVIPDLDLVVVHRMDTTGSFTDPGDILGALLVTVIGATD